MKHLFSFVVPVYGTEEFLPRCLDSIFAQSAANYEVILVDDCSPGNCAEIAARYGNRLKYVRHESNRGLLQARLTGSFAASGEFLVHVDSDDFISHCLICELTQALDLGDTNVTDVIAYWMSRDTLCTSVPVWHNHAAGTCSCREMLDDIFAGKSFWPVCGKAIRRELYCKVMRELGADGLERLNATEDMLQTIPVLLAGRQARYVAYPGYHYWKNEDSISQKAMSSDSVEEYARHNLRVGALIKGYMRSIGADPDLDSQIQRLQVMTLEFLLGHALRQQKACAMESARRLAGCYGELVTLESLMGLCYGLARERDQYRQCTLSKAYRIGSLLAAPIRKVRSILTHK